MNSRELYILVLILSGSVFFLTGFSFPSPATVQVKQGYSALDSGYSDWLEQRIDLVWRPGGRQFRFSGRKTDRYDKTDYEMSGLYSCEISEAWQAQFEISNSSGRILPDWFFQAGGSYIAGNGRVFNFSFRRSNYNDVYVDLLNLTPEYYWRNYRLFYTLTRADNETGEINFNHRVGGDYYYGKNEFIGFGIYTGDEVEKISGDRLLDMEVEGIYWRGKHRLPGKWALVYVLGYHSQGEQYNRRSYRAGVNYYF